MNNELIRVLETNGFEVRSYSGRGMYGAKCVGCALDSVSDIFQLGIVAGDAGLDGLPSPQVDNLGLGVICYWPELAWPED